MSPVGRTYIFPRVDNIYEHKESLAYDEKQTRLWRERPSKGGDDKINQWGPYTYLGLIIGITAYLMTLLEEFLSELISGNF